MRADLFNECKTGHVVAVTSDTRQDWAFVPDALPPAWRMAPRLWPLVVCAREAIARLDGIGSTLPNPQLLLRPLQRREALRSSSLEGTYVTAEQLLLFEFERHREPRTDEESDWHEVFNYYKSLRVGFRRLRAGQRVTADVIRELHRLLLHGVRGQDRTPGMFRTRQVHIRGEPRFTPPPPEHVPTCISDLERYLAGTDDELDALVRAFVVHYQFEAIHPFLDGNGRVGRLLLSLTISDWMGLSLPWVYLSEYFEQRKEEYVGRLLRVSTNGEWDEWIEFCLAGAVQQAEISIDRCARLQALRDKYRDSTGHMGPRMYSLIDRLFASPVVRIAEIARAYGITYPTAKADVLRLMNAGILAEIQQRRPKAYAAYEVLDVAYGNDSG